MSVTAEPPPTTADARCAHCGAPLADDQEWCLECGSARTLIHRAPDWRVPFAIVGGVILLVLAGVVLALIGLSADANRIADQTAKRPASTATAAASTVAAPASTAAAPASAATTPAAPTTSTAPSSSTTTAAATPARTSGARIAGWPVGLGGWTVVLAASTTQSAAQATATRIAASGASVGVLDSSQHPSMAPGYWVVFSGRYPTGPAALAAAVQLRTAGYPSAHVRLVEPPGG